MTSRRSQWLAFWVFPVVLLVLVFAESASSQGLVFGIKPGLTAVQSSYFGMDVQQFQPYIGLDFARLSFSFDEGGQDPSSESGSAFVLVPHLGSRYYFSAEKGSGEVVPYVQGDFLFSIASVGGKGFDAESKELAEDALGFIGISAAFGAEYYFSERFSIGGEYGFRFFADGVRTHRDEWNYDGASEVSQVTDKLNVTYNVSYVTLTLNFHL